MPRAIFGAGAAVETEFIQLFIFVVFLAPLAMYPLAEASGPGAVDAALVFCGPLLRDEFTGSHLGHAFS